MSAFNYQWFERYLVEAPKVIFDVGTYDGADAAAFKEIFPEARVVAI